MKVIIPSKGRSTAISTHKLFTDYLVVVHNQEEFDAYLKNSSIDPDKLVNANCPFGGANIRNWILEHLVEDGEWFVMADDNHEFHIAVNEENYMNPICRDRRAFETKIEEVDFWKIANDTMKEAEKVGTNLCGFAIVDNYFFREKKFRHVGFCVGKITLIKKTSLRFDAVMKAMDDYEFTAANLKRFGKVVINNYLFPIAKHNAPGGIGTYKERLNNKLRECRYLMDKYPKMFRYKTKAGCHPLAEIQMRFTSIKQVDKWRKTIGN